MANQTTNTKSPFSPTKSTRVRGYERRDDQSMSSHSSSASTSTRGSGGTRSSGSSGSNTSDTPIRQQKNRMISPRSSASSSSSSIQQQQQQQHQLPSMFQHLSTGGLASSTGKKNSIKKYANGVATTRKSNPNGEGNNTRICTATTATTNTNNNSTNSIKKYVAASNRKSANSSGTAAVDETNKNTTSPRKNTWKSSKSKSTQSVSTSQSGPALPLSSPSSIPKTSALELTIVPRQSAVGIQNKSSTTQVCATIQARNLKEIHRAPIDMVVALDVSNSMDGPKIDLCKRTLELLLDTLTSQDRFGLVTYASNAQVDIPTKNLNSLHKQKSLSIIKQLNVRNKTNMSAAISLASEEIRSMAKPNAVRTIFLLTDGLATEGIKRDEYLLDIVTNCMLNGKTLINSNQTDTLPWLMNNDTKSNPEIPKYKEDVELDDSNSVTSSNSNNSKKKKNANMTTIPSTATATGGGGGIIGPPITMHTFGYGNDHNAKLLADLAAITRDGSYYHVNNDDDVGTAFGDALGGVLSIVAQNVILNIQPSRYVPSTTSATTSNTATTRRRKSSPPQQPGSSTKKQQQQMIVSPRLSKQRLSPSPPTIKEAEPSAAVSTPVVKETSVIKPRVSLIISPPQTPTAQDDDGTFRSPPTSLSNWKCAFEVQAKSPSTTRTTSRTSKIKAPPFASPKTKKKNSAVVFDGVKQRLRSTMTSPGDGGNKGKPKKNLAELKAEYQNLLRSSSSLSSSTTDPIKKEKETEDPSVEMPSKSVETKKSKVKKNEGDDGGIESKDLSASSSFKNPPVVGGTKQLGKKASSQVERSFDAMSKKSKESAWEKRQKWKSNEGDGVKKSQSDTPKRSSDKQSVKRQSSSNSRDSTESRDSVDSCGFGGAAAQSSQRHEQELQHRISKIYREDQVIEEKDDGSYSVSVGDFYAEEARDVLFELDMIQPDGPSISPMPLVSVSMSFWDTIENQMVLTPTVTCSIDRPIGTQTSSENPHVQKQWLRVSATSAMKAAQELAHKGDLPRARGKIKSWQTMCEDQLDGNNELMLDPMVGQLLDDMEECLAGMESKATFDEFGNKALQTRLQTHVTQRSSECSLDRSSVYRGSHKTKLAELFSSHSTMPLSPSATVGYA